MIDLRQGTEKKRMSGSQLWAMAAFAGLILSISPSVHALPPYGSTTAGITDASRAADSFGDFLRAIWVSPGTQVR